MWRTVVAAGCGGNRGSGGVSRMRWRHVAVNGGDAWRDMTGLWWRWTMVVIVAVDLFVCDLLR